VPALDEALRDVTTILDQLELRYAVGGSVAAAIHGFARSANDLDMLVEIQPNSDAALAGALRPSWYFADGAVRAAVELHGSFSAMHLRLHWKVDFFVAGASALDHAQLDRCASVALGGTLTQPVRVSSAELMVLRKLDWLRRRSGASDVHWFDALGMLKVQAGRLDEAWMRRAAAGLGVTDLLDRALRLQGPPPR